MQARILVHNHWEANRAHSVQCYIKFEALRGYMCTQLPVSFICIMCIVNSNRAVSTQSSHHLWENGGQNQAMCTYGTGFSVHT